jgi:hypothetical protein
MNRNQTDRDEYSSAAFEAVSIITPAVWRRIVAGACAEAMEGEPRAREWLIKVLDVENAVDAPSPHDDESEVVTVNTLMREMRAEKRRTGQS